MKRWPLIETWLDKRENLNSAYNIINVGTTFFYHLPRVQFGCFNYTLVSFILFQNIVLLRFSGSRSHYIHIFQLLSTHASQFYTRLIPDQPRTSPNLICSHHLILYFNNKKKVDYFTRKEPVHIFVESFF